MLAGELKDPRLEGSVIASEVRVQPDMKHARVFVSVKGTTEEQTDAIKALEHAAGFIRHELVERLQLRRLPELHFALDLSEEHVERIEQLLREVKKDELVPNEIRESELVHSKSRKKGKPTTKKKSSR